MQDEINRLAENYLRMNPKEGTILLISQVNDVLAKLNDSMYSRPLKIFNQSSIGAHIRHIADFYNCLIKGAKASCIDYEHRERNVRIETEIDFAITTFCKIKEGINILDMNKTTMIKTCFDSSEIDNITNVQSSIGRELMYAYDHAIHHLAIVKIGLQVEFPSISIDSDLGVAPSTIKYRKQMSSFRD